MLAGVREITADFHLRVLSNFINATLYGLRHSRIGFSPVAQMMCSHDKVENIV